MSSEIKLVTSTPNEKASWVGLRDLARIMPTGWSLAGGTLVRLHGVERHARFPRATTDIDIILDIRAYPESKTKIGPALSECGFKVPLPPNPANQDHRWERIVEGEPGVKAQIDVLAPSGLGAHTNEQKFPGIGRLLTTRGGQLGIDRSEMVNVCVDSEFNVTVSRPDLVGALYEKCSAILNTGDANKVRHFEDINFLTTLFERGDRAELQKLRKKELKRIASSLRVTIDSLAGNVNRRTYQMLDFTEHCLSQRC